MKMFQKKKKMLTPEQAEEIRIQEFFDRIVPSTVRFFTDHFICGNSYKCVWAVREWPTTTEEQAILAHLADRNSVTLRIYNRLVDSAEQRQIIQHATRRNKLMSTTNDVTESLTAIEYIRNAMKRVRKKESAMVIASQNVDDFLIPEVRELTKPLFAIPTHQFLFNAGNIEPKAYTDTLQLEMSEFSLIRYPERGSCLYRCGNERYLLQVHAPGYKEKLFGKAGGR